MTRNHTLAAVLAALLAAPALAANAGNAKIIAPNNYTPIPGTGTFYTPIPRVTRPSAFTTGKRSNSTVPATRGRTNR